MAGRGARNFMAGGYKNPAPCVSDHIKEAFDPDPRGYLDDEALGSDVASLRRRIRRLDDQVCIARALIRALPPDVETDVREVFEPVDGKDVAKLLGDKALECDVDLYGLIVNKLVENVLQDPHDKDGMHESKRQKTSVAAGYDLALSMAEEERRVAAGVLPAAPVQDGPPQAREEPDPDPGYVPSSPGFSPTSPLS